MVMRVASFFPFQTSYYLNGHSFIEQELRRAQIGFREADNASSPAAEVVERRAGAKENTNRCPTCRTQGRESVSQAPERVRQAARPAVNIRWEPYAGKPHVRFCAGGLSNGRPYRNRAMQARPKAKIAGFGCMPRRESRASVANASISWRERAYGSPRKDPRAPECHGSLARIDEQRALECWRGRIILTS